MLHDHKGATRPLDDSAVYHAVCLDVTHEQTIDLHKHFRADTHSSYRVCRQRRLRQYGSVLCVTLHEAACTGRQIQQINECNLPLSSFCHVMNVLLNLHALDYRQTIAAPPHLFVKLRCFIQKFPAGETVIGGYIIPENSPYGPQAAWTPAGHGQRR